MNKYENFGKVLSTYRNKRGYSQNNLAQHLSDLGYSVSHASAISRWEQGINLPEDFEILVELEKYLIIPDNLLIKAAGYSAKDSETTRELRKEHYAQLADIANQAYQLLQHIPDEVQEGRQKYGLDKIVNFFTTYEELYLKINSENEKHGYQSYLVHCFLMHIYEEYQEIQKKGGLEAYAKIKPNELVDLLKEHVFSKTFTGKCKICQKW